MRKTVTWKLCMFLLVGAFCMGTLSPSLALAGEDPMTYKGEVFLGTQSFNEGIVLGWIAKILIDEYTGLDAKIHTGFTSSSVLHRGMMGGDIDIYPSYTGTQLSGVLRYEKEDIQKLNTPEKAYEAVKKGYEDAFKVTWIQPLGFNNSYTMAVRREDAEKHGLSKASDLAKVAARWRFGCDEEFDARPDGYKGWAEWYKTDFKDVLPMQYSIMYRAIGHKEVEAIAAYTTDSRIKKLDLVTLEDDKKFFPDYSACYVVRMEVLQKYPALKDVLEKVSGKIDSAAMREMNWRFDDGEEPEDIASEFLKSQGLLQK